MLYSVIKKLSYELKSEKTLYLMTFYNDYLLLYIHILSDLMNTLLLITFSDILQGLFNIVYTWCKVADNFFA